MNFNEKYFALPQAETMISSGSCMSVNVFMTGEYFIIIDKYQANIIPITRTEPILYKKVILRSEREARRFMTCLRWRQSPHSFTQAAVKRLCMFGNMLPTIALEILEHCTGITALAIWIQDAFADSVRMQEYVNTLSFLMELSLNMSSMFYLTTPSFAMLDVAHRITHLEILDGWVLWTSTVGIEEMT